MPYELCVVANPFECGTGDPETITHIVSWIMLIFLSHYYACPTPEWPTMMCPFYVYGDWAIDSCVAPSTQGHACYDLMAILPVPPLDSINVLRVTQQDLAGNIGPPQPTACEASPLTCP